MFYRVLIAGAVLSVLIVSASPAVVPVAGQTPEDALTAEWPPPPPTTYTQPRTPWGDPDLQGTWDFPSRVPMERPELYEGKPVLTDEEWAEWLEREPPTSNWYQQNFVRDRRTSLVVDPPNGRIPPLTPEAVEKVDAHEAVRSGPGRGPYDSWEDFHTIGRCIAAHTPQGPMLYNSAVLFMQSPGWVVMVCERLDTRVIPLDGRPHLNPDVRQWKGDSRGHWEGSTLVVETRNFTDKQMGTGSRRSDVTGFYRDLSATAPGGSAGPSFIERGITFGNFLLTERVVPVSPTRMHYYATLEDPTTWTRPWTFMLPWVKDDNYQMLEYGCVEGDISVGVGLTGERIIEEREPPEKPRMRDCSDRTT
jgi:hypothetical protein